MRIAVIGCVAALAAAALAGCGGGGGGDGDGDKPKTLRDWTSKVDDICVETQKKLDAVGPVAGSIPAIPDYYDAAIPIERSKLRQIEALGLPPGQQARARLALDVEKRILDLSDQLRRAALADNGPKVATLMVRVRDEHTEAGHLFSLIGASRCFTESS